MFILKFFSRYNESGTIPSYRAMACTSYEVSPPQVQTSSNQKYASIVMHLLDGDTTTWDLGGNEHVVVENQNGSTIDKIRNPAGTMPEHAGYGQAIVRGAIEYSKHQRNATSAQASVRAWEREQMALPDYEVEVVS